MYHITAPSLYQTTLPKTDISKWLRPSIFACHREYVRNMATTVTIFTAKLSNNVHIREQKIYTDSVDTGLKHICPTQGFKTYQNVVFNSGSCKNEPPFLYPLHKYSWFSGLRTLPQPCDRVSTLPFANVVFRTRLKGPNDVMKSDSPLTGTRINRWITLNIHGRSSEWLYF